MSEQISDDSLKLPIYHLTPATYYYQQPATAPYTSLTFAQEGFVHCTSGAEMLVTVANRYFAHLAEPLFVLEIDPTCLTAPLKFEPPLPPPHHESAPHHPTPYKTPALFPHIYGPINRAAIVNCFPLHRGETGQWIFQSPS